MTTERPALRGLYGITDPTLCPGDDRLVAAVEAALRGGMRILQYRDKQLPAAAQLHQARKLHALCQAHGALFIVNDDIELAQQCGADGVHLGRDDGSVSAARRQLGEHAIIGCSCYDRLELALEAQQLGADYVAFGRFHASSTKPDAVHAPIDLLDQASAELAIPICAIGGIETTNAGALVRRGAHMIAVINGLFGTTDIERRAREFAALFV